MEGLTLSSVAGISIDSSLLIPFVEAVLSLSQEIQRAFNSSVANGEGRMNFLPTGSENALLSQPGDAGCDSYAALGPGLKS